MQEKTITQSDKDTSSGGGTEPIQNVEYTDVVVGGKSDYKIVIPSPASECETFSADELSGFIKKITGATLPIIGDASYDYKKNDKVISIGRTKVLEKSGIKYESIYPELNLEGFYIDVTENSVIIDAKEDVGVLYGVYDLLEKYGGVRFVTEDYTYIPTSSKFSVARGMHKEVPAFQLRSYLSGIFYTDKLFMARKRFGCEWGNANPDIYGGGNDKYMTNGTYTHDTFLLCDPALYMDQYPQMFNIVNGRAREICFTYGITEDGHIDKNVPVSGATVILDSLKTLITDNPEKIYFFVGQQDDYDAYCTCETCMRRYNAYGKKRSAILVIFMNAILEQLTPWVKATFPGREVKLATFAYHINEDAPVYFDESAGKYVPVTPLAVPDENLYIRIAPIRANFIFSFDDERQAPQYYALFKGWSAITDRFWIWDYATNYSDFNFIFPNIATMSENYKYYRDLGVSYCMTQADHRNTNDFQDRLKIYVTSKLMWNPDEDADALVREFFELYFGKYSKHLYEFWDMWNVHLNMLAQDSTVNFYLAETNLAGVFNASHYPLGLLERSMSLINGAIEDNAADATISEAERIAMHKRLLGALVVPECMILRNIGSYYGAAKTGDFAKTYFEHVEELGQIYISESRNVNTVKSSYGL